MHWHFAELGPETFEDKANMSYGKSDFGYRWGNVEGQSFCDVQLAHKLENYSLWFLTSPL